MPQNKRGCRNVPDNHILYLIIYYTNTLRTIKSIIFVTFDDIIVIIEIGAGFLDHGILDIILLREIIVTYDIEDFLSQGTDRVLINSFFASLVVHAVLSKEILVFIILFIVYRIVFVIHITSERTKHGKSRNVVFFFKIKRIYICIHMLQCRFTVTVAYYKRTFGYIDIEASSLSSISYLRHSDLLYDLLSFQVISIYVERC